MPKSFLVKRKCCPHACEGDMRISLEKDATESDAQSLEMSCDNDFRRTSVITHSALLAEDYPRPVGSERTHQITKPSFPQEYSEVEETRRMELRESPLTCKDLQWFMRLRAEKIHLIQRVEIPTYDYPPHSPSSSIESPLSPASCHSVDVSREEIEQRPFQTRKLFAPRQERLDTEDYMWRDDQCPSPVFPYQLANGIRKKGGELQSPSAEIKPKHTCKDCGKSFLRASSLSNHKLIHRNVKAFHCEKCGMSFLRKSDLGKHVVTHTGIKPYQCDICHKRFSQSSNMLTHRRRHTGTRPFSCRHCGKAFYRKVDVRRHSRIHE